MKKQCKNTKVMGVLFIAIALLAIILLPMCEGNSGYGPVVSIFKPESHLDPFSWQVAEFTTLLSNESAKRRAGAVEALGFLRAYEASDMVTKLLDDQDPSVRREAAMSLGWCGSKKHIPSLIRGLEDNDWTVRQSAAVSLQNLTGQNFHFNALSNADEQLTGAMDWKNWWIEAEGRDFSKEVNDFLSDETPDERRLSIIRALGAMGGTQASEIVSAMILPYVELKFNTLTPIEVDIIQAGLLSLGRLQEKEGFEILLRFFQEENWARYAADALGDFGNASTVEMLLDTYPCYSRKLEDRVFGFPERSPSDDKAKGDNKMDRMHETPYAIVYALSRLIDDGFQEKEQLKKIGPLLLLNFPSDYDGAMVYQVEADQLITSFLLDKAGLRELVCDAAFRSASVPELWKEDNKTTFRFERKKTEEIIEELARQVHGDVPYLASWLPAFCTSDDAGRLIPLLDHENGWIRINAAKALMFNGVSSSVDVIAGHLSQSHPEGDYGYSGVLEHAEYNAPSPRWREAFIRALGRLGGGQYVSLLEEIVFNERNAAGIQYAAALALDELGTRSAIKILLRVERDHPFSSVHLVAAEAINKRALDLLPRKTVLAGLSSPLPGSTGPEPYEANDDEKYVFIKGDNRVRSDFNGQAGVDPWRQTYSITNSGPAMRVGFNLYLLHIDKNGNNRVEPLTTFRDGLVADCEVSWDGKKIFFSRRLNGETRNYKDVSYKKPELTDPDHPDLGSENDPWWHIWEMNADGTGLRQLTFGPFHDVAPAQLPDGRIVFSSSRSGLRDEYHGFPAPGLSVMNVDGSDIHVIGFNLGADRDPAILHDGRIVFSRLDIFYSRLKTEVTVQTAFPDGTRNLAMYGPESRPFWKDVHLRYAAWTMRNGWRGNPDNRNRVLRLSQPQPIDDNRIICASSGGLVIGGPGPYKEALVPHDRGMAVTSPFPIGNEMIVCAATPKVFLVNGSLIRAGTEEFQELDKGPDLFKRAVHIDLALYKMNIVTGEMEMLYNDPDAADFEARPLKIRSRPVVLAENPFVRTGEYSARLFCNSAFISRIERVSERGKYVRVIEGQPLVIRHSSQHNRSVDGSVKHGLRWKNHGGTIGRVLGTTPLAADGSFYVEVPADRLIHLQILDSDRRVLGNQTFWLYARPGETRSCVGCHEERNKTSMPDHFALAAQEDPVCMLPAGDEFNYLAKAWMKGWLPDEIE